MKANNWLLPFAFFMAAFSIGMDLHHTHAIEVLSENSTEIQSQTNDKIKTYEVQVVWVREGTVGGGGSFPTYPDIDYDSGMVLVKTKTWPDSATVASQADPPGPGYKLDRITSLRQQ